MAAEVTGAAPTSLTLLLDNPGVVSEPCGVGVEEVNGALVPVVRLSVAQRGERQVGHTLEGLREGCEYRVRHRVLVGEADLDAAGPWSQPAVARTPTRVEMRLVRDVCDWALA